MLYCIFGLLHCSEFTMPSVNDYDPAVHLSLENIATDSHTSSTVVRINIKQSKTDPFRNGIQLFFEATDGIICPVKVILPYLALRGSKFSPLFIMNYNIPLTRQSFSTSLSAILAATQLV